MTTFKEGGFSSLNKIAKNKKAIVWAHNVHIAKSEFEMTGETERIKGNGIYFASGIKK